MLSAAGEALGLLLAPESFQFLVLGVLIGTFFGILPALGGSVGMSIVLPFIFGMDPIAGLALLVGLDAVNETSDTFTSVLLGVPGSSSAQSVIVDGYPMTLQGRAAEALGASFASSLVGGIIGAVVLFFFLFAARPVVLAFGSPQLLMLVLLGLSMVGILSRGAPRAGLLAAAIGLFLGAVGGAPTAPVYRFTFGQIYLFDGLHLAVIAIGLFAIPEVVDLLAQRRTIQQAPLDQSTSDRSKIFAGIREALTKHKMLITRSSLVGALIGVMPGLGGSVAGWVVYGLAARTSKNNENFGKGDIRGVIAPEASNNSQEGGTLVPTMLFGVPGSGSSAILLGGLILLGLQPGPRMLTTDLPILMSLGWMLVIANILAALICLFLTRWIVKIVTVPAHRFAPFLFVLFVVGAYQTTRNWGDILVMLLIGIVGWIMKQVAWPRPPLLIGFVLADGLERYLWISTERYGFSWLTDPIVLVIGALIVLVLVSGFRFERKLEKVERDIESSVQRNP